MPNQLYAWGIISVLAVAQALGESAPNAGSNPKVEAVPGDYLIQDFRFSTGGTLPELKVHYRTLGQPVRNAAGQIENAILLLHGTTGTGEQFLAPGFHDAMFGPGKPLDSTKYYLIFLDSIGLGGSSKPSDGLRNRFPSYGYHDMVELQHRLVTDGLHVQHLRAILGTSMDGMHAWLWAEEYPIADGVIAIACLPEKISGRNLLWRRIITTDTMERAKQQLESLRYVLIPASDDTRGNMTLGVASVYAKYVAEFLQQVRAAY